MKRVFLSIMALSAIGAVVSGFISAPKRFATLVFVTRGPAGVGFSYTTVNPSPPLSCFSDIGRCEISTNIPISSLPMFTFPAEVNPNSPVFPHLRYISPVPSIYK